MSEKLTLLIEKEESNLKRYKAKRAEYDEKVRKSESKLREYKTMQNSEKFNDFSAIVQKNGLSVEDILTALKNGDLLSLQEQMENAQQAEQEFEAAVGENAETINEADGDVVE